MHAFVEVSYDMFRFLFIYVYLIRLYVGLCLSLYVSFLMKSPKIITYLTLGMIILVLEI